MSLKNIALHQRLFSQISNSTSSSVQRCLAPSSVSYYCCLWYCSPVHNTLQMWMWCVWCFQSVTVFCLCTFYWHPTFSALQMSYMKRRSNIPERSLLQGHLHPQKHVSEHSLNHPKWPFQCQHAHFVWFPSVLHQLLQTELVLQLPVQIVLEALVCSHGSSATERNLTWGWARQVFKHLLTGLSIF